MTNKFTKIYDTVLETQDLVQRRELREGYMDDAWENMGADDLNRTMNLVGAGGAAITTALYAASATPLAPIAAPAAAIASGLTNLYDLGVGGIQSARAKMEDDPELKNKKWEDAMWNFTSAIPLAGDVAQVARAGKVAGMPLIKQMRNIPGADKALAATSKLSSGPAQLGAGALGMFGSGPMADVISPAPESSTVANKGEDMGDQSFDDFYNNLKKQQMYSRMPGIGEYSRLANNPSGHAMGFTTRQPLIAHIERIAKGTAQNLMEAPNPPPRRGSFPPPRLGQHRPVTRPVVQTPGQQITSGSLSVTPRSAPPPVVPPRAAAAAADAAADGLIPTKAKGLFGLITPFAVATGAAIALPTFYGRRGREIAPPEGVPPLGAPGTGDLTGGISNAIERLQGVAGGAAQFAQYMPPGIGELGRRAAMMAAGRMT